VTRARVATGEDAEAIAPIHNEGIADRLATFETEEVGTYSRHAKLDGAWRDTVIVERLIGEAAR
jgi:L-amino acid N-acyltransferase YncA